MNSSRLDPRDARDWHADAPPDGLVEYWDALRTRWPLIAVVTVVCVVLVLLVTLAMTEKYRGSTTLQIERETMRVLAAEDVVPAESPLDRDFYQTQYELLGSRSLAKRVIRDTHLASDKAYADVVEKVTDRFDGSARADKSASARQAAIENALTDTVLANLDVEPVRNSRLVTINFDSPDPALSARVANAYAQAFMASNLERRLNASTFAVKYLSDRLEAMRGSVEGSEKKLVDFAGQEAIVSMGADKPSLVAQNLSELNALLATSQDARIKADAAWQRAKSGDGLGLPQVVANPLIQNMRAAQSTLELDYQQKLSTFKPDYPEMRRLRSQINEGKQQIAREVANVRNAIQNEFQTAQLQEQLIEQRIASLKTDELDLQDRSIQYNMLQRDVDKNRQLYDALLQRFKEVGAASNLGANNIYVIDRADVPGSPSSPKMLLNVALGLVFGLGLGVLLALVGHFLAMGRRADPRPVSGVA